MNGYSYTSLSNIKSTISLKNNIKIMKYFNNNNNKYTCNSRTLFDNIFNKRKNNNLMISNLLNSSKKLVKNNSYYKSYTNLPKAFRYNYPYKPPRVNSNTSTIHNPQSKKDSISAYTSLENNLNKIQSCKREISRKNLFKMHLKNFNFNNNNVNEAIFYDFIEGHNINSNHKEKYNNYLLNHPMDNDNELNIFQLFEMLKSFKVDYNDNNFFNDKSTYKINKFKLKNNISVKIKISSLNIKFYKVKQKKKFLFNGKEFSFDDLNNNIKSKNKKFLINTKLKLPFGFLPFFYGLNIAEFLRFLITIIDYDYTKNIFFIDNIKFIKNYKLFEKVNSFFGDNSFYQKYYDKEKEYFMYDWDVKNKNETLHYIMKIILPQIKISLGYENKTICQFFYSVRINRIIYLIREKFKLWDFHILKYFSEFKIFRQEVNRTISDTLSDEVKRFTFYNNKDRINNINKNLINQNKNMFKKKYNFNKSTTKMTKIIQNKNSFEFFFSRNINAKSEGYFFQILVPKIHVKYYFQSYLIEKFFDLDIKRMSRINKLRKCFSVEDLIKYSMVIIDQKNDVPKERKSIFEHQGRRSIKRAATYKNFCCSQKLNLNNASIRTSLTNLNNPIFANNRNKSIRGSNYISSIKNMSNEAYNNKDIKLNLDKYIFNFDDDILKYIKPLAEKKKEENKKIENKRKIIKVKENINVTRRNSIQIDKNKLNVELGKIKLIWNTNDSKENVYFFKEIESEYLLENPIFLWEKYIENNFEEFKSN